MLIPSSSDIRVENAELKKMEPKSSELMLKQFLLPDLLLLVQAKGKKTSC
jgi:hypothetical protein